jgi:hypothetical protein
MSECPQTNMRGDECADCLSLIRERDLAQHYADELALAISVLMEVEIGEHSNLNNPWHVALEAVEAAIDERRYREREMELGRILRRLRG